MRKISLIVLVAVLAACNAAKETADGGGVDDATVEGDGGVDAGQDAGNCYERLRNVDRAVVKLAEEYKACAVDADCIAASPATKCVSMCNVAVAKSSKAAFDTAKATLGDQMCDVIWADCGKHKVEADCVGIGLYCTSGKCTGVRCDKIIQDFNTKADDIHTRHSSCSTDQDCDYVSFQQGCIKVNTATVNAAERQAFTDEVSGLEGEFCSVGIPCGFTFTYSQEAWAPLKCTEGTCQWDQVKQ